jgi:hypothetical protein
MGSAILEGRSLAALGAFHEGGFRSLSEVVEILVKDGGVEE